MLISHIGHQNMNHKKLELEFVPHGIEVGFDRMEIILE